MRADCVFYLMAVSALELCALSNSVEESYGTEPRHAGGELEDVVSVALTQRWANVSVATALRTVTLPARNFSTIIPNQKAWNCAATMSNDGAVCAHNGGLNSPG